LCISGQVYKEAEAVRGKHFFVIALSLQVTSVCWPFGLVGNVLHKCTKHQFIHLLTATLKNSHIKNSKNHKRWYCPHHTDCVSNL